MTRAQREPTKGKVTIYLTHKGEEYEKRFQVSDVDVSKV
jgi:hypothetical protein